jgi:TonB family protein
MTDKTILPPSWGHGDSFHVELVKSGRYSVRGKISDHKIVAAEIKYLGTAAELAQSSATPSATDNQSQQSAHKVVISASEAESLLLAKTAPAYPPNAKDAGISGTVELMAKISKEGVVQDVQLISGHTLLTQAAIDAVKQWRYKPYLVKGEPTALETTVNVVFALGH